MFTNQVSNTKKFAAVIFVRKQVLTGFYLVAD